MAWSTSSEGLHDAVELLVPSWLPLRNCGNIWGNLGGHIELAPFHFWCYLNMVSEVDFCGPCDFFFKGRARSRCCFLFNEPHLHRKLKGVSDTLKPMAECEGFGWAITARSLEHAGM